MVASTMLTDAYGDYWSDGTKVEKLEAIENAISEIEELGFETYAQRTLAQLIVMREFCNEAIKEDAEFDGVCPYCGEYLEYDD